MYLTLYEISKITKCNRSSLKTIINYLNLHYIEIFDKSNKIRKIYSNDDLEKIKNFLNEHPYPKTFFSELTNIKKYGVRNQFQRKEIHDKGIIAANTEEAKQHRKETCLIKYNGECPTADKTVFEKSKTTRIQNNGQYWTDNMLNKSKETKFRLYNDENYNNREQAKETCILKYNVPHPMLNKDISNKLCGKLTEEEKQNRQNKTRITSLLKYNTESPNQCHEIICKMRKKYIYNNLKFDSSWEVAYYIWLKDHNIEFEYQPDISFEYEYNGKIHKYFPDFKINNLFYEIKGGHLLKKMLISNTLDNAKYNCMLKNNITIISDCAEYLNYIKEKYGKLFLYSCKCK